MAARAVPKDQGGQGGRSKEIREWRRALCQSRFSSFLFLFQGLIPEDYEPYPDDGDGLGDYPNLKPSSADSRSGHVDWDMPEDRRNFGEPLRYEYDMTTETRYDDTTRMIRSDLYHWMVFLTCIGSYLALFLLSGIHGFFRPVAEEQLPYKEKGKVKTFYEFHVEKPE